MKKAYIAGKVSGLPIEEVVKKFVDKEEELIQKGYTVFNPIVIIHDENYQREWHDMPPLTDEENRKEIMRICVSKLLQCDELHLLPDWEQSAGAWEERTIAQKYGIDIVYP